MNKIRRVAVNLIVVLAGAVFASALMLKVGSNDSWLAFAGWVIFFAAIQSPLLLGTQGSLRSCTAWLSRPRR